MPFSIGGFFVDTYLTDHEKKDDGGEGGGLLQVCYVMRYPRQCFAGSPRMKFHEASEK